MEDHRGDGEELGCHSGVVQFHPSLRYWTYPLFPLDDLLLKLTGIDFTRCLACKKGTMVVVAELPKPSRWDSS